VITAFDLDGVLYNFLGKAFKWLAEKHNVIRTIADLDCYDILTLCPSQEIARDLLFQFTRNAAFYIDIEPIHNARRAVVRAAEFSTPIAITARGFHLQKVTNNMVARDFPDIRQVHFSGKQKVATARRLGVRWLIEDHPQHAMDAARAKIRAVLINTDGNGSLLPFNAHIRSDSFLTTAPTAFEAVDHIIRFETEPLVPIEA